MKGKANLEEMREEAQHFNVLSGTHDAVVIIDPNLLVAGTLESTSTLRIRHESGLSGADA